MRIIKFRAWDELNQEMVYEKTGIFSGGKSSWEILKLYENVMQFTGLHDKNGKEIYVGDIIGDWTEIDGKMEQSRLTVYFDEMIGQWMLDISFNQDRTSSCSLFAELKDFEYEILGNIYENPELLTD